MDSKPQFKVFGTERRVLKKHLAEKKRIRKYAHYYRDLEQVMGGVSMDEEEFKQHLQELDADILYLENQLKEKFKLI